MGDPVGIGPEIILRALNHAEIYEICRPLVIGDPQLMKSLSRDRKGPKQVRSIGSPHQGTYEIGIIDVLQASALKPETCQWGRPTPESSRAMLDYVHQAIDLVQQGMISAIVTCPINKEALALAGEHSNGHTEIFAKRTGCDQYAMMLAGDRLRIVLVTIHIPLNQVPGKLSVQTIANTIKLTHQALMERFGIRAPKIAVAGLNPHAGESGLFGHEEGRNIIPAINLSKNKGICVEGPFPADTLFYHAVDGAYDAVVCMYHDQGLIPFKMIHFKDGVNTTIGIPVIRTSVDHGTAYDIAGAGKADPGSLIAAVRMAADHAVNVKPDSLK